MQALPHSARCVRFNPTPDHPTNLHLGFRISTPSPLSRGLRYSILVTKIAHRRVIYASSRNRSNDQILPRGLAVQFAHRRAKSAAWRNYILFSNSFRFTDPPKVVSVRGERFRVI